MNYKNDYRNFIKRGFNKSALILLVVFLLSCHNSYAQSSNKKLSKNEQILEELVEMADSCGSAGLFQEVIEIAQTASKKVRKPERYKWPFYQLKAYEALALMSLEEPDYEKAISILKEIEKGLPEMASYSHSELGRAYMAIGHYDEAIPYLEQVINERTPQESNDVYWLLQAKEMLATAYRGIGDYDTSADVLCSFFDEQVTQISHDDYINLLARAYYDLVVHEGNIIAYDKSSLRIIQELAKDSKERDAGWYVYFEGQIAQLAQVLGDFQLAYDSSMEAITQYSEKSNVPLHVFYTSAAAAASRLGNFPEAHQLLDNASELISQEENEEIRDYFERELLYDRSIFYIDEGINSDIAIANIEYLLTSDKIDPVTRAGYLYNLGQVYDSYDYTKAEEVYNEALKYYEIAEGHSILYAKTINQLGLLSLKSGAHENAMKYFELSIDIFKRRSVEGNYSYALTLGNAARCAMELGQYGRAIAWGEESCRIQKDYIGYMYPQVWDTMLSAYSSLGNGYEYERVFNEYAQISQLEPSESVNYQIKLINRLYNRGDVEGAIASTALLDSLFFSLPNNLKTEFEYPINSIKERLFPGNNDLFLYKANRLSQIDSLDRMSKNFLRNLGFEFSNRDDYVSANTLFKLSYEPGQSDFNFLYSAIEAAALSGDEEFGKALKEDVVSFVNAQYKNVIGLTEDEKEYYWRDIRDLQNMLFYYRDNPNSDKSLFDILLKTKNFLLRSNIALHNYLQNSGNPVLVSSCDDLKQTRKLINELQRTATPELLDSLRLREININRTIVKNVKDLSGFDIYGDLTFDNVSRALNEGDVAIEIIDYPTQDGFIAYAAFVVSKSAENPLFVTLCKENELEELIRLDPHKLYDKDLPFSSQLFELIWKPLMPYLPEGGHVYLSPSGTLNIIALEAIAIDDTQYINDFITVSRLTTTAELCNTGYRTSLSKATVFGGINYKTASVTTDYGITPYSENAFLLDRSTAGEIAYLPGTKAEAENVSKILIHGHLDTQLCIGDEGTEEAFKSLSGHGISIIHIATHGFYQPKDKLARIGFFGERDSTSPVSTLQRSGLLMAGSEPAWNGKTIENHEDGVLTASEISELDFSTTQLVVMSACESGLGEITDDGVAGLQRSFKNAGVRSLVMSLWKVDDKATEILMTTFYKNLANGMSIRNSFFDAQAQLRKNKKYSNPYYWASFVLLD